MTTEQIEEIKRIKTVLPKFRELKKELNDICEKELGADLILFFVKNSQFIQAAVNVAADSLDVVVELHEKGNTDLQP